MNDPCLSNLTKLKNEKHCIHNASQQSGSLHFDTFHFICEVLINIPLPSEALNTP